MTKNDYRTFFAYCKSYIVFKPFLIECNIPQSNFSRFMKSSEFDYYLSIDKLECLYNSIKNWLYENIV